MGTWAPIVVTPDVPKGDALERIAHAMQREGIPLGGWLQKRVIDADGKRVGYDVVELAGERRLALARVATAGADLCDLVFRDGAFDEMRASLLASGARALLLEVGPLEAAERGHWRAIRELLATSDATLLLVVRPRLLASLALRFPDPIAELTVPADSAEIERFAKGLASQVGP